MDATKIVDRDALGKIEILILPEEVALFVSKKVGYY
jgi:hypothetical protein